MMDMTLYLLVHNRIVIESTLVQSGNYTEDSLFPYYLHLTVLGE